MEIYSIYQAQLEKLQLKNKNNAGCQSSQQKMMMKIMMNQKKKKKKKNFKKNFKKKKKICYLKNIKMFNMN